jgi:ABC-2 type transport system ATP-binding protein
MITCGRTGQVALRTEQLTKHYGTIVGLEDLNMTVTAGEVLGYLGPNGAGKTTTIRLLLGLIRPTAGRAEIFGMDVADEKVAVHARVAYVPGEAALWPSLTGAETLHLLARMHGQTDVAYRDLLVKRFDFDTSRKVRVYSKGNRQKISLIAALATRADLLILDEPTAGLDPLMQQAFRESVLEAKDNGQTVFLSSHVLSEAEALCDRIAILRDGRLAEIGTLAQMRHLSAVTVEASFTNSPPPALDKIPGVSAVQVTGHHLSCQVRGRSTVCSRCLRPRAPRHCSAASPRSKNCSCPSTGSRNTPITEPTVASTAAAGPAAGRTRYRLPQLTIAWFTGRRAARAGALWGLAFGIYVYDNAFAFHTIAPTAARRDSLLASMARNAGLKALLGDTRQITTLGGFIDWRAIGVTVLVASVWGLMAATKALRGEEAAGRWELLLAGLTTPRRAAANALTGLGAGVVAMYVLTARDLQSS